MLKDSLRGFDRDLRYAVRGLKRRRLFTLVIVFTLAIGIGCDTAMFSVVQQVIFRPFPYENAEEVVTLWSPVFAAPGGANAIYLEWMRGGLSRDESPFLEMGGFAYGGGNLPLPDGDVHALNSAAFVTPNLMRGVLRVEPILGRGFDVADFEADADPVLLLSYALWRDGWDADPDVVGESVRFEGRDHEVIGVMDEDFALPIDWVWAGSSEIFVPWSIDFSQSAPLGDRSIFSVARLRRPEDAGSLPRPLTELAGEWLRTASSEAAPGLSDLAVFPLWYPAYGRVRPILFILSAAVLGVLLIACANVAGLQLAQVGARRHEIAVRAALGAPRRRLVRQLLTESFLLALLGGLAGLAMSAVALRLLVETWGSQLQRLEGANLDGTVLLFCLGVCCATTFLFGLAPALRAVRGDLTSALHRGGAGASDPGEGRRRDLLAVVQIAVSVVLLLAEILLVQSLVEISRIDLGFNPRVLVADLILEGDRYPTTDDARSFEDELLLEIRRLPGVENVAYSTAVPMWNAATQTAIASLAVEDGSQTIDQVGWELASPDLFWTLDIARLGGRGLSPSDRADTLPVIVLNEAAVAALWGDEVSAQEILGLNVRLADEEQVRSVIGVYRSIRDRHPLTAPRPQAFLPATQPPEGSAEMLRKVTLLVRGDPDLLSEPVLQALRGLDEKLSLANLRSLEQLVEDTLLMWRLAGSLLGLFAVVALLLATLGVYGVLALSVTRRRREIGIRLALGASARKMVRSVTLHGMRIAAAGTAIGCLIAWLFFRWSEDRLDFILYGVRPDDPTSLLISMAVLLVAALFASAWPAQRAGQVDPASVLRED